MAREGGGLPGWVVPAAGALAAAAAAKALLWGPSVSELNGRNPYLTKGNFAPVYREVHAQARIGADGKSTVDAASRATAGGSGPGGGIRVLQGAVPADLRGAFVRVGPNPTKETLEGSGAHWFDGDGMVHGVCFLSRDDDDTSGPMLLTYANHQLRTMRLAIQKRAGRGVAPGIGSFFGWSGYWRMIRWALAAGPEARDRDAPNPSNTALLYHDRRLMALCESGSPFVVRLLEDGAWESVGFYKFGGRLARHPFTAHPKVCPRTGNCYFFGYNLIAKPWMCYAVSTADGELVRSFDVGLDGASVIHDFAITEQYAVLMDLPIRFKPARGLAGKFWFDSMPEGRPARFGVLHRDNARSAADIRWFDAKPCFVFHTMNAWEEGDEVVMWAVRFEADDFWLEFGFGRGRDMAEAPRPRLDHTDVAGEKLMRGRLHEWRFNLKTGETKERPLCPEIFGEFPSVSKRVLGSKSQWGYMGIEGHAGAGVMEGLAKIDMRSPTAAVVGRINFGGTRFGGEPVFVPRPGAVDEDDGWLMTFVHDDARMDRSELWIMDAKTMAPEPLCVLATPQRVPAGFHGTFVTEDELAKQRPAADSLPPVRSKL